MSSMMIIKPHVITDAMLTSTIIDIIPAAYAGGTTYASGTNVSVAGVNGAYDIYKSKADSNTGHAPASSPTWWDFLNTAYQEYNVGSTYAAGNRVQDNVNHIIYESAVSGNVGQLLIDTTKWLKVGSTAKWAAYDDVVGTQSIGISPMTQVITPGASTSGLAMFELSGARADISIKDMPGGTIVYTNSLGLDGIVIATFYDWFFAESGLEGVMDVVLVDLPGQYLNPEITITITGDTESGKRAGAGVIKPGIVTKIGTTQYGTKVSIIDYSKKEIDDFGNASFIERAWAKKASFPVLIDKRSFNRVYRFLASRRAKPCIYIGTDIVGYEPLLIYGKFTDFSIDISDYETLLCALEVEGLI